MSDINYTLGLALKDEFAERLAREYQYQPVDEEPPIAPSPDPSVAEIKHLVQTSFWASLTKGEGKFHDFRLVFMPVDEWDGRLFVFRKPLPFEPEKLAKIAPALLPTFRVGVWRTQDAAHLEIWGFAPSDHDGWPLYIEASAGEIVVSLPSGLKGVITPTLGSQFVDPQTVATYSSDLREIAKGMRRHGHGGTLLVLPNEIEDEALDRLIHTDRFPFWCRNYERVKTDLNDREREFAKRAQLERQAEEKDEIQVFLIEPEEAIKARESLQFIAELTAADGATLVTHDLRVLGFGAKIKAEANSENNKVESIEVSDPFEGSQSLPPKSFSELGWGTRHQSAAQFVGNQKDSIAIVASEDGAVSFFTSQKGRVNVVRHSEFVL
jgi:hypothetical protein